jgi:hypothetical protein
LGRNSLLFGRYDIYSCEDKLELNPQALNLSQNAFLLKKFAKDRKQQKHFTITALGQADEHQHLSHLPDHLSPPHRLQCPS